MNDENQLTHLSSSENQTNPVFEWSICVRLSIGPVFGAVRKPDKFVRFSYG
jgi:hypothetical protein